MLFYDQQTIQSNECKGAFCGQGNTYLWQYSYYNNNNNHLFSCILIANILTRVSGY